MAQRSDQTDLLPAIILKLGAGEIAEAAGVEPEVVAALLRKTAISYHNRLVQFLLPDILEIIDKGKANVFYEKGEYWLISYEGKTVYLKRSKGLSYIRQLITAAGRELHVTQLGLSQPVPQGVLNRLSQQELEDLGLTSDLLSHAGPLVDQAGSLWIRSKLVELEEELGQAQSDCDIGRVSVLNEQIERLQCHIASLYSISGQVRKMDDPVERLRKAVSAAIADAKRRIHEEHEPLWKHLQNFLHSGVYCSYRPDREIDWSP